MEITLSDSLVMAKGWMSCMDVIGKFTKHERKTAEEMKQEREIKRSRLPEGSKITVRPYKHVEGSVLSHDKDDPDVVWFLPGLWPRVKAHLDSNQIPYQVKDMRNMAIRPAPDYSVLEGEDLRFGQDETLALVALSDCGIINAGTGYGKSYLISKICAMYPTLRILIVTKSTSVVATLIGYIGKELPGQIGYVYTKGDTSTGKRIVVTTTVSIAGIPAEKVDLLLFDEVHAVGQNKIFDELGRFIYCRKFGFSASPWRDDGTALCTESMFGPVIQTVTYEEAREHGMVTAIKYVRIPCKYSSAFLRDTYNDSKGRWERRDIPDHIRKRYGYWMNTTRNKLIASTVYDIKEHSGGQILIMTESLEHAIRLHMLLPWFVVVHYGATDLAKMKERFAKENHPGLDLNRYKMKPSDLDRARCAFAKGTLRYVICTTVWAEGCSFDGLCVLIRADGRVSTVASTQIPGRLSRLADGKDYGYLIDFTDEGDQWSAERSLRRKEGYDAEKWQETTLEDIINDFRVAAQQSASGVAGENPGEVSDGEAGGQAVP